MRRAALVSLSVGLAAAASACGGDDEKRRMGLTTPPERQGAEPLPEIAKELEQARRDARVRPTQKDAERLSPVLRGWARALRRNDYDGATEFFNVPAIVAQGRATRLETREEIRQFNAALPCGAKLLDVSHDGRYVVGTFRLTRRPQHLCDAPGELVRVAFVMRDRKIAEWRQVPDTPGAAPGPDAPENAPPAPVEQVA